MVVAFRVKIGLSSSISAGRVGAFVCLVRESLWDRFEAPPLSPAGGRTECAARDASCRRSEHASSTHCAVRSLARLDRSAATVPRTGITGGSACSAARCGSFGGYARARLALLGLPPMGQNPRTNFRGFRHGRACGRGPWRPCAANDRRSRGPKHRSGPARNLSTFKSRRASRRDVRRLVTPRPCSRPWPRTLWWASPPPS